MDKLDLMKVSFHAIFRSHGPKAVSSTCIHHGRPSSFSYKPLGQMEPTLAEVLLGIGGGGTGMEGRIGMVLNILYDLCSILKFNMADHSFLLVEIQISKIICGTESLLDRNALFCN